MKSSISVRTPFKVVLPEISSKYELTYSHIDQFDTAYFVINEIDYEIIQDFCEKLKYDKIPLSTYNGRCFLKVKHSHKSFRVRNRLMDLSMVFYSWEIDDQQICTCEIRE